MAKILEIKLEDKGGEAGDGGLSLYLKSCPPCFEEHLERFRDYFNNSLVTDLTKKIKEYRSLHTGRSDIDVLAHLFFAIETLVYFSKKRLLTERYSDVKMSTLLELLIEVTEQIILDFLCFSFNEIINNEF